MEIIVQITLLTKTVITSFITITYLGLDPSYNFYVNPHSCEIIHMLQQENFLLNLPQGCKE